MNNQRKHTVGRQFAATGVGAVLALAMAVQAGNARAQTIDVRDCIAVATPGEDDFFEGGQPTAALYSLVYAPGVGLAETQDMVLFFRNSAASGPGDPRVRDLLQNSIGGIGLSASHNVLSNRGLNTTNPVQYSATFPNMFAHFAANANNPYGTRFPASAYSPITLIAGEVGARWSGHINPIHSGPSIVRDSLFSTSIYSSWSYFFHNPADGLLGGGSVVGGNVWTGTASPFSTTSAARGYSQLDLYLMGLVDAGAVAPTSAIVQAANVPFGIGLVQRPPAAANDTRAGIRQVVDMNLIQNTYGNGNRLPPPSSPQLVRQAFVLLNESNAEGAELDAQLAELDGLRAAWSEYFPAATSGRGLVETCGPTNDGPPTQAADIVFLVDLSGSYIDDLPVLKSGFNTLLGDLEALRPGSRYAVASLVDFPLSPFGLPGDYAYRVDQDFTTNTSTINGVVQAFDALPGAGGDTPQSQYESLWQIINPGQGLDLNGDGSFDPAVGDIPVANTILTRTPGRPLIIYLFTDAPFHDADTEDYPAAGDPRTNTHGGAEVRDLFLSPSLAAGGARALAVPGSPGEGVFVVGLISGSPDTTQMDEIAALSGGSVQILPDDSTGFEDAAVEAIKEVEVPVLTPSHALEELTIPNALVRWNSRSHGHALFDDFGGFGYDDAGVLLGRGGRPPRHDPSQVELSGTFELGPNDPDFEGLEPTGRVAIEIAGTQVFAAEVDMEVFERRRRVAWLFADRSADEGLTQLSIVWTSPSTAEYYASGKFDAVELGLKDGRVRPGRLDLFLQVGSEPPRSGQAAITEADWNELGRQQWKEAPRSRH